MSEITPNTPQCKAQRISANPVSMVADHDLVNWPGNHPSTVPLYLIPKTLGELAGSILQAERAGHHVRAHGSLWSFSDAVWPGSPEHVGAMISTEYLGDSLESDLTSIVATGVDTTFLIQVEAGITAAALTKLLAQRGQTLEAGGGSGQTLAGMMSTSTHSGDSLVPPLVDYVRAIHLVGAGGIEYWIERDSGITDPAKLQNVYPCLATGNIHYDSNLFNAVLVSAGSMGVIYSVVIETVAQFGLLQHRVATTWEDLLMADPNLAKVIDGSYLAGRNKTPPQIDLLDKPIVMGGRFGPNSFAQIVINPYPLDENDGNLSAQQRSHAGKHLCFVTNRVQVPVPTTPASPGPRPPTLDEIGEEMGKAALTSLAGAQYVFEGVKFKIFADRQRGKPATEQAAALVEFLADNYYPLTISALINFVLKTILPVHDRTEVNLSEVIVWDEKMKSFCVEAAFTVPGGLAFVPKVLALVASYAARSPRVYIGGYLALRIVGKKTDALLGMQRWSPTCCVEYLGLAGSRGIDEFADDLQRIALASGGILHFGLQNNVMTAADMQNAYGPANIEAFRRARGVLSQHGSLTTFDNNFTDRLGLSGVDATPRVACSCATNVQGDLHVCAIDQSGGLWHTIRKADGTWPLAFGDVQAATRLVGPNAGISPTPYAACATDVQGDLHVCAIDQSGGLWHTIRKADGTWPLAFGDVQAATRLIGPNAGIGPTPHVACATNAQGDLHVCAIDQSGGLWHTIRKVDGTWPLAFGDVQAAMRSVGPNAGIGSTPYVACATNAQGDLHVCAIGQSGGLWHTIRKADGTWPLAFGDVQAATRLVGPNAGIGPTPYAACATNVQGDLHVCAIDQSGGLWHTIRKADGTWPLAFGDVQAATRLVGPNAGIGPTPHVACATNAQGDLQVCAINQSHGLWHTIRIADGTWPFAFGHVQ